MTFKPGETVRLKGGSQPMTVRFQITDADVAQNAIKDIGVTCDWHTKEGRPNTFVYAPEQLVKVELAARYGDKS